ncbi:hypothetical protein PC129_g21564 [Phytophthora cactorum]|uniref:RxLR effector protein n=2 Tax=Phytophthora cactorum TaxID=29920 RepID=A0A8T1E8Q1_9STRA|nr:hypothetical protein GQ600_9286 [Phytophthora cactorum]KAG2776026.1 hypothetical protein Pcac1_g13440 [Phytophthora cactorum]KAG2949524.1 hypothetical protein PC118_g25346 [Phytophthora cactorum]KAG3043388.1 hypothetical protein PC122_g25113 [Phytophthora cactorum]KAG3127693.1 hypothetical protein C6341_g24878 [Phytophthora cactorum]
MRLVDCVNLLVVSAFLVLTSCDATFAVANTDQTRAAEVAPVDALYSTRGVLDDHKRYLRSDATTDEAGKNSANDEEREIIPASLRIALKRLVTKDDTIYTHGRGDGGEKEWWVTVLKKYRKVKDKFDEYFRKPFWYFRFTVWMANRRTPAIMYERLNVISTTGIGDKNYRVYINYLRFYEHFKGPTYNPILDFGPKVKID